MSKSQYHRHLFIRNAGHSSAYTVAVHSRHRRHGEHASTTRCTYVTGLTAADLAASSTRLSSSGHRALAPNNRPHAAPRLPTSSNANHSLADTHCRSVRTHVECIHAVRKTFSFVLLKFCTEFLCSHFIVARQQDTVLCF